MSGFTIGDIRAVLRSFILEETKAKSKFQELLRSYNPIGLKELIAEVP